MADTVPGDATTRERLALDGNVTVTIDTGGDHDWYKVRLVAGKTYEFSTSASGANTDSTLTLRDAGGTEVAFNDDSSGTLFSKIVFTATTTGTYYIDGGAYNATTGNYKLTFTETDPPEPLPIFNYDQIANQLTDDFWDYFGGSRRSFAVAPGGELTVNVTALTAEGRYLAREALATWTDVTGISFREVTGAAQISFDDNQSGAFANSTTSGATITSSIVNISTGWLDSYGTTLDTYSFQTYIHEIGHAIGLGHGSNYNGSANYPDDAGYQNDAWNTTVMSYFSPTENTYFADQGFTYQFVGTPMVGDSVATTDLYGVNTLTRTGNTTYGFNDTSGRAIYDAELFPEIAYAVYDGGGKRDTLDYSGFDDVQLIDLRQEQFSNVGGNIGNVTIARGTVIENAIGGSGADTIVGNAAANQLTGGAGEDSFRFLEGTLATAAKRSDTVTDFVRGDDTLDFSGYDAVEGTSAIDRFDFIGRAAFSGEAGELRYDRTAQKTTVSGDTDGDGAADFVVTLTGRFTLNAGDFTLDPAAQRAFAPAAEQIAPHKWQHIDLQYDTVRDASLPHLAGAENAKWAGLGLENGLLV